MTDAEIKVWRLFSEEVFNIVEKDFTVNESRYRENVTLAIMMLENIVQSQGLIWNLKLKTQSSYGIPYNSVDEFVELVLIVNAIRKMKKIIFE